MKTAIIGAATINGYAFANCDRLTTVTVAAPADIKRNAFDHCSAMTTFNYLPEAVEDLGSINGNAFTYCTPYVVFNTTKEFIVANPNAPLNTAYGADAIETTIKTVQDKANANQFVAKFASDTYNVIFNAASVKLFSVYVDGDNAYFQACRTYNGKYFVAAGEHVILKTTEAKDVNYVIDSYAGSGWKDPDADQCVGFDDVKCLWADGVLGDIQRDLRMTAKDYLYRLTNTTGLGFGFTEYSGTTIKAGQFFVKCTKAPAAGRLNTVWLDEDGNVIDGEATGIETVKNIDANNGAIYNLQGVRVDNPTKGGLYIQNGKKIVVK
jgi:hypothetical protein